MLQKVRTLLSENFEAKKSLEDYINLYQKRLKLRNLMEKSYQEDITFHFDVVIPYVLKHLDQDFNETRDTLSEFAKSVEVFPHFQYTYHSLRNPIKLTNPIVKHVRRFLFQSLNFKEFYLLEASEFLSNLEGLYFYDVNLEIPLMMSRFPPGLRKLEIIKCTLSEVDFMNLISSPFMDQIQHLDLRNSVYMPEHLHHLTRFQNLKRLRITGQCGILRELQEAIPSCEILVSDPF